MLYEKRGNEVKEYIWLGDRPLARIDNGTSIYYYRLDRLGTSQGMSNQTGAVVWRADYEPFGKANVKVSIIENNVRFPGQYYDKETGLHYNYFRDYDPTTGRYIEADPIGLGGGLNLYAYAGGNPIKFTDPLGLIDGFPRPGDMIPQLGPTSGYPPADLSPPHPKCTAVCIAEFVNPIPDALTEKSAEKIGKAACDTAGDIAKDVMKKFNKVKGAYDLGSCLAECNK